MTTRLVDISRSQKENSILLLEQLSEDYSNVLEITILESPK